jgi:hypothetical protein
VSIELECPGCRAPLSFPLERAGASGPCYRCGATVTVPVPPISVVCARCGTASEFHPAMLGRSGPCRGCGAPITVAHPAPPSGPLEVAPARAQESVLASIAKEAGEARIQVLGAKVVRIANEVTTGESIGAVMKASFLFGSSIRTDRVQAVKLRSAEGDFFLVVPWSGNMMLAHELAALVPGTLPSNVWLSRGALGAWSSGRYSGTQGGERDPIAQAADKDYALNQGIEWDWESGRIRIKLDWGLQAVCAGGDRTLHLVHTAQRGIVFKDFGLGWYLERRRAFAAFVAPRRVSPSLAPAPHFTHVPLTTLFLSDLLAG